VVYSNLIRERFRHPRYQGSIEQPDAAFEDVNPLCGDRIRIECRIAGGRLADARHRGDSCAICVASADVLLERAIGEPLDLASRLTTADLLERLEADVRASRIKCVTLPLTVLQGALDGREVAR
jgi:nitrogen fixation protein NifU and related proteins